MLRKIEKFVFFMLIMTALGGCAVSEDIEDADKRTMAESTRESTNEREVTPNNETHLRVSEFHDYAPFYSVSFQKIEGETGKYLSYEGSTETEDMRTITPDNVRIEPEEDIWELSYWFDGNLNLADTVTLQFWNRGNADSVMIEIDGLEYELTIPSAASKQVTLNQIVDPLNITIKNVSVYSKALLFELEGVDKNNYMFLLTDSNGSKTAPTRVAYNPEETCIQLLYVFENPIENKEWIMKIKDLSNESEEQPEYVECNLKLK